MSIPVPLDYTYRSSAASYGPVDDPFVLVGATTEEHIEFRGGNLTPRSAFLGPSPDGLTPLGPCVLYPPCIPAFHQVNGPICIATNTGQVGDHLVFHGGVIRIIRPGSDLLGALRAFDDGAGFCYHVYAINTNVRRFQLAGHAIAIPITPGFRHPNAGDHGPPANPAQAAGPAKGKKKSSK